MHFDYPKKRKVSRVSVNKPSAEIRMTPQERAVFLHEVNTYYHSRFEGRKIGRIIIDDFDYKFEIFGFADYRIIRKRKIDD